MAHKFPIGIQTFFCFGCGGLQILARFDASGVFLG